MSDRLINWFKFASPQAFYPLAGKMIPWFWALAALFGIAGLYVGFLVAPTDAQQGEGYRIIFLHVPASWMSMFIYLVMAFWAGLGLAFNFRLSGMMATALAPTGALFAFLVSWDEVVLSVMMASNAILHWLLGMTCLKPKNKKTVKRFCAYPTY